MSEDKLEVEGTVIESSKGIFRVKLENDHIVIGHLSGKMKMYKIRVLPGDTVTIELSPYDLKRGTNNLSIRVPFPIKSIIWNQIFARHLRYIRIEGVVLSSA